MKAGSRTMLEELQAADSQRDFAERALAFERAAHEDLRAKVAELEKENSALLNAFPGCGTTGRELREANARIAALEKELENWRRGTVPDDALEAAMRINWVEMVRRCAALEAALKGRTMSCVCGGQERIAALEKECASHLAAVEAHKGLREETLKANKNLQDRIAALSAQKAGLVAALRQRTRYHEYKCHSTATTLGDTVPPCSCGVDDARAALAAAAKEQE